MVFIFFLKTKFNINNWEKDMSEYKGKKVILYGLGTDFIDKKEFLENYFMVIAYTDKRIINIKNYISVDEIVNYEFDYIYICTFKHYKEIKKKLVEKYCLKAEKIISEYDIWKEIIENKSMREEIHFVIGQSVININVYRQDICPPIYNQVGIIGNEEPEIYNKYGYRMDIYFLRDIHFSHKPYYSGEFFMWDRYNWGLDTHFYTHNAMKQTMGNPIRKYGILSEPRSIEPESYKLLENNKEFCKEFDAIFTHDDKLLENIPNAKFVPFCAEPWYGRNVEKLEEANTNYQRKLYNISIISSDKEKCEMHRLRKNCAIKCKEKGLADTYGTFDGGNYVLNIEDVLSDYRYSIVIENDISKYYFTEKLTSCFVAQTVPIYCGAEDIGKFFNINGIIFVIKDDLNNIEKILKQCNERDYLERVPAILDNYERVKQYKNCWDYMYINYLKANK